MMTTTSERQWVGIDVSQEWLDIALRPAGTHWRCPNQEDRMARVSCSTQTPRRGSGHRA
jgi:hypothetical protein